MNLAREPLEALEPLEPRRLLAAVPDVVAGVAADTGGHAGALDGKIVYLNGGHGFAAAGDVWRAGRPETFDMVEDFGNQDQLRFAAEHLLRAGATIAPLRPIGHQPLEVVLDNDDAGVTFAGNWSDSGSSRFFGSPGDVPYRFADTAAAESATATYRPDLPAEGFYPVYTWVLQSSNRADQLYKIEHTGGTSEIRVDHSRVGNGWVYLGTYHFDAGTAGSVTVSNQAGGGFAIADAIRFGNGQGDVDRGSGISGQDREDEASLYWIERSVGVGTSFSQFYAGSTDENANVGAPPRFARHMNAAPYGQAVFVSYHTNAGGGNGRGTLTLHNTDNGSGATPNQFELALLLGREVNDTLAAVDDDAGFESSWFDRGNNVTLDRSDIDFGEIRGSAVGNEFDATIIEVGFHDNATDAALLRDPTVRDAAGRATYEGLVRYFNEFGGSPLAFAPLAPAAVSAYGIDGGGVALSYDLVDATPTGNPDGYDADPTDLVRVEVSTDGRGFVPLKTAFAGGFVVLSPAELAAFGDGPVHLRLVAQNLGGSSVPSRVVSVRPGDGPKVLVVDAFDRVTRQQDPRQTTALTYNPPFNNGSNTFDRVRPRGVNSFDYAAEAGNALAAAGVAYDTVQNEAVPTLDLGQYAAVVWLAGEESSVRRTFDAAEQSAVAAYLAGGGNVFVSGSEVAWDLGALDNGRDFLNNALRTGYVGDDAGTYFASGVAGGIFDGLSLTFDDGDFGYDVDFPDVFIGVNGSQPALRYATGGVAALAYDGPGGGVVTMGFGFESILGEADQAAVMGRVMGFFGLLDDAPPVVVESSFSAESAFELTWRLDEPIDPATFAASDVTVFNETTGQALPTSGFFADAAGDTLRLRWDHESRGPLPDGRYTATLAAGSVSDEAGNVLADGAPLSFGYLLGDLNGDLTVSIADFAIFRGRFGAGGAFFSDGDLNGDGQVSIADFAIFRGRFGAAL